MASNYDGVNGKRGLKEFKALHDAIFGTFIYHFLIFNVTFSFSLLSEAVKEEGLTFDKFKKDMQHCFKTFKNRFYSKKCREKKSNKLAKNLLVISFFNK